MNSLRRKINEILRKVQTGAPQINLKRLQNLYRESDFEHFVKDFMKCLYIILKAKNDQCPYRDKLLIFIAKFCTSLKDATDDEEALCPLLKQLFVQLFKEYNPDVISPYRVCQLIQLLLKEIGEQEAFLDEYIFLKIRDLMLERIDDVKPKVRVQAIEVLQRLQEPLDNNDAIIKAFIERLNDDNSQVRKHIVQCIGLNVVSIPVVIGRCLDVSDEVRLVSYDKLSKVPIKALKIAQRQFILRNGFADKNPKIKNFILKNLLPQWLSTYNGDYFQLIRALKLDADEQDFKQTTKLVEKVLSELFNNTEIVTIMEALPLEKEKLITSGEVQWEEILFWRCLQQFLRNKEGENDYVDKILPELIFFCDYVSKIYRSKTRLKSDWEIIQHEHMMFELLQICHDYDYSDEVGRNALQNIITTILIDGPSLIDITELLVKMFEKLIPDTEERATKFSEIIAEIQTPMTPVAPSEDMVRKKNVKLAGYRCKLNIAEDEQEKAIEKEDYDKAAILKKDIAIIREKIAEVTNEFNATNQQRIPKTDTSTLCRCLDILTASLQNVKIKTLPESYRAFQDIFLPPLLNSREPEVFWRALKQLCLFAAFDDKLATESMKVFFSPLLAHKFRPVYGDQTTITAIMCITDMILIHGSKVFEEEDNVLSLSQRPNNKRKILDRTAIDETVFNEPPPPSLELVIEILSELLDDTDDKIKETVGDSLITLILTGRVRSSLLFSKLLLKWFSPITLKDVRLRQMIGILFTDYVPESPYSLEVIEQAFVPTLQAIIEAPRSSPLADVDVDSVSRFLAALSEPGRHKYNAGLDAHKNIAMILCREICDRPNNKRSITYIKTLLSLEVPREDDIALDILRKQVDTMQELVKEKMCLRYIFKYRHKLDNDTTQNTISATTINSVLPESTINTTIAGSVNNTANAESVNNAADSQKDDEDSNNTSRYSTLSVKRRKRHSKNNGEEKINGKPNDVLVRINRNEEIEQLCARMVVSETDSEYSTENGVHGQKKKMCTSPTQQINKSILKKDDTNNSKKVRRSVNFGNTAKKEKKMVHKKKLAISLIRNNEIDIMCSQKSKPVLTETHSKNNSTETPSKNTSTETPSKNTSTATTSKITSTETSSKNTSVSKLSVVLTRSPEIDKILTPKKIPNSSVLQETPMRNTRVRNVSVILHRTPEIDKMQRPKKSTKTNKSSGEREINKNKKKKENVQVRHSQRLLKKTPLESEARSKGLLGRNKRRK